MLSVITLEELERLYRDHRLDRSVNFHFLENKTQLLIKEIYEEEKKEAMATVIYTHTIDGKVITEVDAEAVEDANHDTLAYLPSVEPDQLLLIVEDKGQAILISSELLEELEEVYTGSEQEKEYYKDVVKNEDKTYSDCLYAVGSVVRLEDIKAILYPEAMEARVQALREKDKERGVLFRTTSLFN